MATIGLRATDRNDNPNPFNRMSIGLLFWVIMIVWLLFGLWQSWPTPRPIGNHIILWLLLALLGWQVFGPALHR